MGYKDINEKAIGFAQSGITERRGNIYLRNKDAEKIQAKIDKLKAELAPEEKALRDLEEKVAVWQQEKDALHELIRDLKQPRDAFETLSDEEFEARKRQLRWEIADILTYYTFIVDGNEPDIQGGF